MLAYSALHCFGLLGILSSTGVLLKVDMRHVYISSPTAWRSVAASAPGDAFKKRTILRAKRSTATPCSAAAAVRYSKRLYGKHLLLFSVYLFKNLFPALVLRMFGLVISRA